MKCPGCGGRVEDHNAVHMNPKPKPKAPPIVVQISKRRYLVCHRDDSGVYVPLSKRVPRDTADQIVKALS